MAPRADSRDDLFTAAPLPVAPLDDVQRLNCLRLIRSANVGPVSFRALINQFASAAEAIDALPELAARGGRRSSRASDVFSADAAAAELEAAARIGATPVFTIEPGYPAALAATEAPPPMLYIKGRRELLDRPVVAIVGSRDCSAAGIQMARQLAAGIAEAGYVIASGLARGIDGAAHAATLETGTIGVLAGGIDHVYPPEHERLMAEIGTGGLLISEQPPGFKPRGQDFPRRNRIISGISLGVVIIEAASRSGTLVTARYAGEQGREVFAVPGHPLDPRAAGTNRLIQNGATLVVTADDVTGVLAPIAGLCEAPARPYGFAQGDWTVAGKLSDDATAASAPRPSAKGQHDISERERHAIWTALSVAPIHVDALIDATGLDTRQVQVALLEFDLAGRLARPAPGLVARKATDGADEP